MLAEMAAPLKRLLQVRIVVVIKTAHGDALAVAFAVCRAPSGIRQLSSVSTAKPL